jgi:hypothetical protein
VLQDVELVENDLGLRQHGCDRIPISLVHFGAYRLDRRTLARVEPLGQESRQRLLRPVPGQPDHLAANQVGQDCPEAIPLSRWISSAPRWRERRFGRTWSQSIRNARSARRALLQLIPCRTAAWLVASTGNRVR